MTPRLATSVWVSALVRRASGLGLFAAVVRKGDPTAGAVVVVLSARDGETRAMARVVDEGRSTWEVAAKSIDRNDSAVANYLARQARFDPDLWVIELTGGEMSQLIVAVPDTR